MKKNYKKIDEISIQKQKALCDRMRIYLAGKRVSAFSSRLKYLKNGMELNEYILAKMDDSDLFCLTLKNETSNITMAEFHLKRDSIENARVEIHNLSLDYENELFNSYLEIDKKNNQIEKLRNHIERTSESAKRILCYS